VNIGFDAADWQRIRETYTAWWRGELNRALVYATIGPPNPKPGARLSQFLPNWPPMDDDEWLRTVEERFDGVRYLGDAFPMFFVNYGAGVAAVFPGATLRAEKETIWFEPPEGVSLGDLRIALDPTNPWWRRIQERTTLLAERFGSRVAISHTDIGGNLDILASLRGTQQLLMDCATEPETVERLCGDITRLWLAVYDDLAGRILPRCGGTVPWSPTWAPGTGYMLQSDFSYMISPEMFGRFVMPDLTACCEALEYPFYHMDGVGQLAHLDQLLSIERLRGIQWVAGAGKPASATWHDLLVRIRDAGKRVQASGTLEEGLALVKAIGGRGVQLILSTSGHSEHEARRLVEEIARY